LCADGDEFTDPAWSWSVLAGALMRPLGAIFLGALCFVEASDDAKA